MALTADQQFQIDLENLRQANQIALEEKRAKLESVRLAKETLIENRRNMPVDERQVSAADIVAYANTLVSYINN